MHQRIGAPLLITVLLLDAVHTGNQILALEVHKVPERAGSRTEDALYGLRDRHHPAEAVGHGHLFVLSRLSSGGGRFTDASRNCEECNKKHSGHNTKSVIFHNISSYGNCNKDYFNIPICNFIAFCVTLI